MGRKSNRKIKVQGRKHDSNERCCFCHSTNLNRRAKVRDGHLVCGDCRDKHGVE